MSAGPLSGSPPDRRAGKWQPGRPGWALALLACVAAAVAAPAQAANRAVVKHVADGQELADAVADWGRTGVDTTLILDGPYVCIANATFSNITTGTDGHPPFTRGLLTLKGGQDGMATVLDAGMRSSLVPRLDGTARIHIHDITFINLCEQETRWNGPSSLGLALLQRASEYQSHTLDNVVLYGREADLMTQLYTVSAQESKFSLVRDLTSAMVEELSFAHTMYTRVTPYSIGLKFVVHPTALIQNSRYQSIMNPDDPLLEFVKGLDALQAPQFCNGTLLPTAAATELNDLRHGPAWVSDTPGGFIQGLGKVLAAGRQLAQSKGLPPILYVAEDTSLKELRGQGGLPVGQVVAYHTIISGPYSDDFKGDVSSTLDLADAKDMLVLAPGVDLFLQHLTLDGLAPRRLASLPGSEALPPEVRDESAALALRFVTMDAGADWAQRPNVWLHNSTLCLPVDEYLAVAQLLLETTSFRVLGCMKPRHTQLAARLAAGIQAMQLQELGVDLSWILTSTYTGWGVNGTQVQFRPEPHDVILGCTVVGGPGDMGAYAAGKGLSVGGVVGVTLGAVIAVSSLAMLTVLLWRRTQQQPRPLQSASQESTPVPSLLPGARQGKNVEAGGLHQEHHCHARQGTGESCKSSNGSSGEGLGSTSFWSGGVNDGADGSPAMHAPPSSLLAAGVQRAQDAVLQFMAAEGLLPHGMGSAVELAALYATHRQLIDQASAAAASAPQRGPGEQGDGSGGDGAAAGAVHGTQQDIELAVQAPILRQSPAAEQTAAEAVSCTAAAAPLPAQVPLVLLPGPDRDGSCGDGSGAGRGAAPEPAAPAGPPGSEHGFGTQSVLLSVGAVMPRLQPLQAAAAQQHPAHLVKQLAAELNVSANKVVIVGLLGHGSWGTVFKGVWRGLPVALKTLVFDGAMLVDSETGQRTQPKAIMEAAIAASVGHRNVVATYHYDIKAISAVTHAGPGGGLQISMGPGGDGGGPAGSPADLGGRMYKLYLVQELCGMSLSAALQGGMLHGPEGVAEQADVLHLALDILRGLEYLHSKGIIHGDLKPANVLLSVDPASPVGVVAKLADFGLSTRMEAGATHVSNFNSGTPFYVAPEVVHHYRALPASDIYSFGVLMWQLSVGQAPFICNEGGVFSWNPAFPRFLGAALPSPTYIQLCYKCLERDPHERPTATELVGTIALLAEEALRMQRARAPGVGP